MKKIFRVVTIILSLVPAALASAITFVSITEGSWLLMLIFGASLIIYFEYIFSTFQLFKKEK